MLTPEMYFSKIYLVSFGNLFGLGDIRLPDFSWLIWGMTIFCVVGVTNAINLIDGFDGLAGGVAFIAVLELLPSLEKSYVRDKGWGRGCPYIRKVFPVIRNCISRSFIKI